jgi:hypothetical protein
VLWVRETWRVGAWDDAGSIAVDYKADGYYRPEWILLGNPETFQKYWIESAEDAKKAGLELEDDGEYHWEPGKGPTRWRSPVTMPREAARLFLRVTDVRVERVQDIFSSPPGPNSQIAKEGFEFGCDFIAAWNNRYAKSGYGWSSNLWVWVIEFERIAEQEAKQ